MPLSLHRPACCLATALLLVACQRQGNEPAQQASASAAPPVAATPAVAPPVGTPAAAPTLAELAGVWRVTGVYADGRTQQGHPALGALLDISAEELRWTYHKTGGAMATDRCGQPAIAELSANAAGQQASHDLAQASLALSATPPARILALGWECSDGHWGPGKIGTSNFAMIGPSRFVTGWYDDSYFQLDRISAPAPERRAGAADADVKADDFAD